MQESEGEFDPSFACGSEAEEVRPPAHGGVGAECECLHDVGTPSDAAITDDGAGVADRVANGRDEFDRRWGTLELSATVVRDGDRFDAELGGDAGVGDGLHALDHDRAVPDRSEPLDVVPTE